MPEPLSHRRFVEDLFRDSEADLRSYVSSRLNRSQDVEVEDIVQESFLRVSSHGLNESIQNPRGFLFRTARNLIIDVARKRTVRAAVAATERRKTMLDAREIARTEWLSPEREVSGQQELQLIMEAIEQLPTMCRRVFLLQRRDELSYAQVAQVFGISESMVQKHMSKALCHLYKALP